MKIAFVTSEIVPFSKTGGLADVSGTLPQNIADLGNDIVVITPLYGLIDKKQHGLKRKYPEGDVAKFSDIEIWEGYIPTKGKVTVPVLFISTSGFSRAGLYQEKGVDYHDNYKRFSYFSRAVLQLLKHMKFKPDVIHCHDWPTALIPVYLRATAGKESFFKNTKSVMTIHNLAYQGVFHSDIWPELRIPNEFFTVQFLEYYQKVNFLKGGIVCSDYVTTVSPKYSKEIQTGEQGCGLEGVLRNRSSQLAGILNGIDYEIWNPEESNELFPGFSAKNTENKRKAKLMLQEKSSLKVNADTPLFSAITRIDPQKGCDILLKALHSFLEKVDAQFIILGTGTPEIEKGFSKLESRFPDKVHAALTFDGAFAQSIYAGSDFFLMPSKYEPCGLGQMISMAYGTVPVVRNTGGLADTITAFDTSTKKGNGFVFEPYSADALQSEMQKAVNIYKNKSCWDDLTRNTFAERFTWDTAAKEYTSLYNNICKS